MDIVDDAETGAAKASGGKTDEAGLSAEQGKAAESQSSTEVRADVSAGSRCHMGRQHGYGVLKAL